MTPQEEKFNCPKSFFPDFIPYVFTAYVAKHHYFDETHLMLLNGHLLLLWTWWSFDLVCVTMPHYNPARINPYINVTPQFTAPQSLLLIRYKSEYLFRVKRVELWFSRVCVWIQTNQSSAAVYSMCYGYCVTTHLPRECQDTDSFKEPQTLSNWLAAITQHLLSVSRAQSRVSM